LWLAKAQQNSRVRAEKKGFIGVNKISDDSISIERHGCPPIALDGIGSWCGGDRTRRAAEIFIEGQTKTTGAVAC
jgi:hypothetical protein